MYTIDEKGNTVLHIITGLSGMKLLKEMGLKDTLSKEELDKHLASHNRRIKRENELFMKDFEKRFGKLK